MKEVLTTGEAAKYCGVSFRTVIRWVEQKKLKGYSLPGRGDKRILMVDLIEFLNANAMPIPQELVKTNDRILIVDDFLSSGSSQGALLQLVVGDAGATAVGVGVLLEKVYDSGRQSLSGFDIAVESLCKIASVQGGVIQLEEEEGFNLMKQKSRQ